VQQQSLQKYIKSLVIARTADRDVAGADFFLRMSADAERHLTQSSYFYGNSRTKNQPRRFGRLATIILTSQEIHVQRRTTRMISRTVSTTTG